MLEVSVPGVSGRVLESVVSIGGVVEELMGGVTSGTLEVDSVVQTYSVEVAVQSVPEA